MMRRSNLPQYRHLYAVEDEWERRRSGGVIVADEVIDSRFTDVSILESTATGRLFLSTNPPIVHMGTRRLVPIDAYLSFSADVERLVESQMFRFRVRARRHGFTDPDSKDDGRSSVVYFIQSGGDSGKIKIGVSRGVRSRLAALQTSSGEPLRLLATVPGDRELERELHRKFAAHRRSGEWFDAAPPLLSFIRTLSEVA